MKREIGSFFEEYEKLDSGPDKQIPAWWDSPGLELVCSGREAIEAALIDIQAGRSDIRRVCILPQYTCDTVIIPFQKHGWRIFFYPVLRDLTVDYKTFEELLTQIKPDVLLMHTYYGVDTISAVRPLIAEWRIKYGLIFIEDITQSLGLPCDGRCADYYVGSLRKWLPISDGGFVYSKHQLNVGVYGEKGVFVAKKAAAQKMKLEYLKGSGRVKKEEILNLNSAAEKYLYENDKISAISNGSKQQLKRIDIQESLCLRKRNAKYLESKISQCNKFQVSIRTVESGPLYFPIYTKQRKQLQDWLKEANIFAPILWPKPEILKPVMTGDVDFIFNHLLALPCDQRYDLEDMKRICGRLCEF